CLCGGTLLLAWGAPPAVPALAPRLAAPIPWHGRCCLSSLGHGDRGRADAPDVVRLRSAGPARAPGGAPAARRACPDQDPRLQLGDRAGAPLPQLAAGPPRELARAHPDPAADEAIRHPRP